MKKKNYKFKASQIGGVRERVASAMHKEQLSADESEIIDLLAHPAIMGKDCFGSHQRLREAFERILQDAAERSASFDATVKEIKERKKQ